MESRVYKDGRLKLLNIPLYSVMNGFWINETGNLKFRYKPQDWFEIGLVTSTTAFSVPYLPLLRLEEREGRQWVKRFEKKIKKIYME